MALISDRDIPGGKKKIALASAYFHGYDMKIISRV